MKTAKCLAIALLTIAFSCNGQTRKELLLNSKNLSEETLPDFVEKYLIDQQKKLDKKSHPQVSIVDNKKEIDMYGQPSGEFYSIPIKKEEFIKGDLTADNNHDIIINVGHSFGASGHNTISFLFVGNSKGYSFIKTFDCTTLAQCNMGGAKWGELSIEEIKENKLIGTAMCYTDDDAVCCPSKKFISIYKYDKKLNDIVFVNQTEKK